MSKKMSLTDFQAMNSNDNWADAPMDEPRPAQSSRPPAADDFPPLGAKPAREISYPTREERRPAREERPREERPREDRPREDRPRDYDRPREDRPRDYDRPREDRPRDYDRPREDREGGYRSGGYRGGDRDRSYRPTYSSDERMGNREPREPREPRTPEPIPDSAPWKAFVANLSFRVADADLGEFFEDNGCQVKDCHVAQDQETHRSRGFGHVEFEARADLEKALTLAGKSLKDREIRVEVEKRRAPSPTQWRSSERKPMPAREGFVRRELRDAPPPPPIPAGESLKVVAKKKEGRVNPFGEAKPVVTPITDVAASSIAPRGAAHGDAHGDAPHDAPRDAPRERAAPRSPPRDARPAPPKEAPREDKEVNRFAGLKIEDEDK